MPTRKTVFAQIMDLVPDYELDKYKGDHKTKKFTCYAQFTRSSGLRVVETTLTAFSSKLYYSGLPPISYNPLNLPNQVTFSATEEGSKEISYHYDVSGFKHRVEHITPVTSSLVPMASPSLPGGIIIGGKGKKYINTTTYCGNMIYSSLSRDNGTSMSLLEHGLERILTEEGYITLDGTTPVYHYFLKDHLGNVRVVMNEDGKTVEQSNNYYPFGGIFNSKGESEQPYKFNGKELEMMHGLNWYDYGARMKGDWRFTTMDPLCEKYYSVSPYAYCLNNPINNIDPDGMSTWVLKDKNGNYRVIGGNLDDGDRNIYLWGRGSDGNIQNQGSIGVSATMTSFYNSDDDTWLGTIDVNDQSGMNFLADLQEADPEMTSYMENATKGGKYDFKRQGLINDDGESSRNIQYYYRGTSLGTDSKGNTIYASARDVGNIGAGFVAGRNNMSWKASRLAFDALQSQQEGRLSTEGISTKNAEYSGWVSGRIDAVNHPVRTAKRNMRSIIPAIKYIYKKLKL